MNITQVLNSLSIEEQIRLFNGNGSWRTYSANGKIPHIFMSDGPHGLRKQDFENYADLNKSNVATCFPTASCIASSWDKAASRKMAGAIAAEARAENVQLMLGPGMNIKRSPLCGRNFEYFSEDPFLTAKMASSYVEGMQENGVGSCIKHFAANNQEKRRQTSSSNIDEYTLRKIYLSAFEYVVKTAKPAAIMCSYNKLNGTYTSHNRHLLTEILRDDWGFEGPVISDWGACIDAAECLKAGLDLAMPDSLGYFDRQLQSAYQNKVITKEDLDRANSRVLKLVEKYPETKGETVDYKKQHALALELAEQSAVLLKNEGLLPLDVNANKQIVAIGSLAENMKFQGGGSSHITTAEYPAALECLKNEGFDVIYEPGYFSGFCKRSKARRKNAPLIKKALECVEKNVKLNPQLPVLYFCGLTDAFEGEGFDRTSMDLPEEQITLLLEILKITTNVILISFSGAPINLESAKNAKAILHMYLCGEGCGQAVAELLAGKVNPSGKLAETWPLKIEDTPCYKNFAPDGDQVNYEEGSLVGYRWYNEKNIPVQFPFGYGLSYTTFELIGLENQGGESLPLASAHRSSATPSSGCLQLVINPQRPVVLANEPEVKVFIKNTGKYAGAEVLQLYYNGELCGFEKVFLNPEEIKTVTIKNEFSDFYGHIENSELYKQKGQSKVFEKPQTEKTEYTLSSSLGDMAKSSLRIKLFVKIIKIALVIMNKKSAEDPSVKIEIAAIEENPVESLISTSGGIISEKMAKMFVKWAN